MLTTEDGPSSIHHRGGANEVINHCAGFLALSVAGLATPSLAQTGAPASDFGPSAIVLPYLTPGAAAPPYLAPGAAVLPYRAPGAAVPYLTFGAIVLPPSETTGSGIREFEPSRGRTQGAHRRRVRPPTADVPTATAASGEPACRPALDHVREARPSLRRAALMFAVKNSDAKILPPVCFKTLLDLS